MLDSQFPEPIVITEKPNYAKVIAITAITVAVVEAAIFAGIFIAKKIKEAKAQKNHALDEGFETLANVDEVHIEFEE